MNVESQTVEQQEKIGMTDGDDRNELQPTCMRAFDGWISVKTRMPNERCLAYTPDQEEQGTWRIIPKGLFKQAASEATHWRPLPPPPVK